MKKIISFAAMALAAGACYAGPDYDYLSESIAGCAPVQTTDQSTLFLCDATDQLAAIQSQPATAKLFQGPQTGDALDLITSQPGKVLVEQVPSESCYRVIVDGIDISNLPGGESDWYMVEVCQ